MIFTTKCGPTGTGSSNPTTRTYPTTSSSSGRSPATNCRTRTADQILATAFNRNHKQNSEGGIIPEEFRVEYVADRANTVGTAFMGLTVSCARCHDHKYDPFSQKNY